MQSHLGQHRYQSNQILYSCSSKLMMGLRDQMIRIDRWYPEESCWEGVGYWGNFHSTAVYLLRASSNVNNVRLDGSCPVNTALRSPLRLLPRESSCPHIPHTGSFEMPDFCELLVDPCDLVA